MSPKCRLAIGNTGASTFGIEGGLSPADWDTLLSARNRLDGNKVRPPALTAHRRAGGYGPGLVPWRCFRKCV